MKKIRKKAIIASNLVVFGALLAVLATAVSFSIHNGFSYHSKINALALDSNKDHALSKDELLSHNTKRFTRLDSNEDGSISKDEFNAHLIAMFEAMDSNGDGILKGDEMPKSRHSVHGRHDYGRDHG